MNRLFHSALPAFMLAVSVGQIYAFTNFSDEISRHIGESQADVQFAFSLGIFFLGMGAAFFGSIVERNIRLSSLVGTSLFLSGLGVTAVGIHIRSLALVYLGYGALLGTGTGIIYISPVKTMMMWFPKHKALAAAFPIISFGLGSTVSTLMYRGCCGIRGLYDTLHVAGNTHAIVGVFLALMCIYALPMFASALMLKKPYAEPEYTGSSVTGFSYTVLMLNPFFLRSWLFMFLNISAGLCLIPLAKQTMSTAAVGYTAATVTAVIALSGLMNGGGRFLFAWLSDRLYTRINILLVILSTSAAVMLLALFPPFIGIALLVINACYGAGFSVIPAILADNFGMGNISKIHGAVLSAWGFAGLAGNQAAMYVSSHFGGYTAVVTMLIVVYLLNLCNARSLRNYAVAARICDLL